MKKELLRTAIEELNFYILRNKMLISLIDEIKTINTDKLIDKIINNGLERYNLDAIIHNKLINGEFKSK